MNWSPQQQQAIATVGAWLRLRYAPFFYLAGYAGTGKTTLARHVAELQDGRVFYAAYTGKAAKVMRQSGCHNARTIHSMIYDCETDPVTGRVTMTLDRTALDDVALVVIDECSMVDEVVGNDLLSFGKPVLVLGDPFQLPPVAGAGFFTAGQPTLMLTEVHRQAKDSPIVGLATDIREGRFARRTLKADGLTITRRADLDPAAVTDADTVIVGKNATRRAYNARLREIRGFDKPMPTEGETLICLRNDRDKKISNGELFKVAKRRRGSAKKDVGNLVNMVLTEPENDERAPVTVQVFEHFFQDRAEELRPRDKFGTQEFDFGYVITAHKAQGSQWPRVCVFDESRFFGQSAARHLYTSVTRAAQHLTLVI